MERSGDYRERLIKLWMTACFIGLSLHGARQVLPAALQQDGVSASAIIPGFVEAGIYAHLKERSGMAAPAFLTSAPEKVGRAVVKAIENDLPEIIINPLPVRPLLAFMALFPKVGEWVSDKTGGNDFFRRVVEKQSKNVK